MRICVVFFAERLPLCTTLLHRTEVAVALQYIVLPLNKLNTKASGYMERDVTVHLKVPC